MTYTPVTTHNLLFAMFIIGSDSNNDTIDNIYTTKTTYKQNSHTFYKQFNHKHTNSQLRRRHNISQPQWRGYSH